LGWSLFGLLLIVLVLIGIFFGFGRMFERIGAWAESFFRLDKSDRDKNKRVK
jgi:hypothetical protein